MRACTFITVLLCIYEICAEAFTVGGMGLAGCVSNHLTYKHCMHETTFFKNASHINELNLHTRGSAPIGRNHSLTSCQRSGHDLRTECFESREGCCTGRDVPSNVLADIQGSNNVQTCTQNTSASREQFCSTLLPT